MTVTFSCTGHHLHKLKDLTLCLSGKEKLSSQVKYID